MERDEIEMKDSANEADNSTTLKIRKPKRILHFSDGIVEEYSDAEEDECDSAVNNPEEHVNEKDLRWGPYLRLKAQKVGGRVLSGMEYVGGGLASIFGIASSEADLNAIKEKDTAYVTKKRIEEENSKTWNSAQNNDVVDESPQASTSARTE